MLERHSNERFRTWSPIVIGIVLVIIAGTDQLSWANTGPWTRPLLEWFYPERSIWGITLLTFQIRKVGHVVVYGCMAILIVRVIASEFHRGLMRSSMISLAFVVAIAIADEAHQATRPSRDGSISDIVFDTGAAILGLLFYAWLKYMRRGSALDDAAASIRS